MKVKKNIESDWSVEVSRIEIKRDEYDDRILRLIKALIEIDQYLFPEDINSEGPSAQVTREAA